LEPLCEPAPLAFKETDMRRWPLSALLLVSSMGIADVARADCCNDFWSCMGAVASAGLSCQIEGLIDTVNSLKTLVETVTSDISTRTGDVIAQAQKGVSDATQDTKQLREKAIADLAAAASRSHDIANPSRGMMVSPSLTALRPAGSPPAGVAAQTPIVNAPHAVSPVMVAPAARAADPKAVQDALASADAYVQDLRSKATSPQNDVANAEKVALDAALRHVATAQRIGLDLAVAPLNALRDSLLDLLSHPERLFDPSAQIDADIQRITQQIPALLDQIANEVTQEAMGDLNAVRAQLQQLQDSDAAAGSVADAMQKVSSSRTQPDLDALNRLLPAAPARSSVAMLPAGIVGNRQLIAVAFTHTDPARLPIVVQRRAAIGDIAARWQSIKTGIKTPIVIAPASQQKVDHDLSQMFAGKSKVDVEKKKQELLEEAKKRFAKDPKTLEKVQKYIEAHAAS
jgi:hypothetical protein